MERVEDRKLVPNKNNEIICARWKVERKASSGMDELCKVNAE